MAEIDKIAQALGRIPSGLFVVTVGSGSQSGAFLASFVAQVSLSPPRLVMGVGRDRAALAELRQSKQAIVHVLEKDQKELLGKTAKGLGPGLENFNGMATVPGANGVPRLAVFRVALECRMIQELDVWADHVVLVMEPTAAVFPENELPESWVHLRKNGRGY